MTDRHVLEQQLKALANEEARALEGDVFLARLQAAATASSQASAPAKTWAAWRLLPSLAMTCALVVTLWVTLNLFEGASAHWAVVVEASADADLAHLPWALASTTGMQALGAHLAGLTLCAWLAGCVWWMSRASWWPRGSWRGAR